MAIDRIGKGGAPPIAPEGPVDKKRPVDATFTVDRPESKGAAPAVGGSSPLAQLRAGQIDLDRYMDLKVEEATQGIQGLSPADLDEIKRVLKDQMATDPGLSDLFHTAAGRLPSPPEE
jgi:hypothetical protein